MMAKIPLAVAAGLLLASACAAQTRITGTLQCDKPSPQYTISVNADAGGAARTLLLQQSKCTWSKPLEIGGAKSTDAVDSGIVEADASRSRDTGYDVSSMDSGDQFTVRYTGMSALDGGVAQKITGTWSFTAGTGKLKGIAGRGTYNGAGNADGGVTVQIVGEYQIPKK